MDIYHSSDEEEEEQNEEEEEEEEEENEGENGSEDLKTKAARISQSRFLTDDDFKKIKMREIALQIDPKAGKKRKRTTDTTGLAERNELLSVGDIENIHKKRKHDKDSRLETVIAGRQGREKFGSKKASKKRLNQFASTSNKEKRKNKNFMMMRHNKDVRGKNKRSFRDKQFALRQALLKNKKAK